MRDLGLVVMEDWAGLSLAIATRLLQKRVAPWRHEWKQGKFGSKKTEVSLLHLENKEI